MANGADPIPGQYLRPYGLGAPLITAQPTSTSVIEGNGASFTIQLASNLGAVFLWKRDGVAIPGATNITYILPSTSIADNGSQFQCFIQNPYGTTNSSVAVLTVTADTTPPAPSCPAGTSLPVCRQRWGAPELPADTAGSSRVACVGTNRPRANSA